MECPVPWWEALDAAGAAALFGAAATLLGVAFVFRVVIQTLRNL